MKCAKFLLIFLLATPVALASDLELKIQEAANLDASGQSQRAKEVLLSTIQSGEEQENALLLFNLGVLSAKTSQFGEAFVYFTSALWMDPLFQEARRARSEAQLKLSPGAVGTKPYTWMNWNDGIRLFSWQPWMLLSLIISALWIRSRPTLKEMESWQWGALLILLFTFSVTTSLAVERRLPIAGILKSTKVMSGPDLNFPQISQIESGALVNIEESKSNWLKIRYQTSTKKEAVGWIESPTAFLFPK